MLVEQHNCGQVYESTVMVMETALSVGAVIVMIQKSFTGNREICHSRFNFYWPERESKGIRVMTAIKKDLADKIIGDHRTDLIIRLYFMLLEICKHNARS